MNSFDKVVVWLASLFAIVVISMVILDTIDKRNMTSSGYEQAYEPVSKTKYWVKVQ